MTEQEFRESLMERMKKIRSMITQENQANKQLSDQQKFKTESLGKMLKLRREFRQKHSKAVNFKLEMVLKHGFKPVKFAKMKKYFANVGTSPQEIAREKFVTRQARIRKSYDGIMKLRAEMRKNAMLGRKGTRPMLKRQNTLLKR